MKQVTNTSATVSESDISKPQPIPVPESERDHMGVRDGRRAHTGSNYGDWRPGDDKKMGPDTDSKPDPATDSSGIRT